jgi:hypothetical protein
VSGHEVQGVDSLSDPAQTSFEMQRCSVDSSFSLQFISVCWLQCPSIVLYMKCSSNWVKSECCIIIGCLIMQEVDECSLYIVDNNDI